MERDKAAQAEEGQRLKALFDGGDTTFTTLGVIDVNIQPKGGKGKGKGKGRKRKPAEEKTAERTGGKENSSSPVLAVVSKKRRARAAEAASTQAQQPQASDSAKPDDSQPLVARAITFR
jgi:hypothetical protein